MDLFSRSGFGTFLFSIHVMIRRFGVVRILLTVAGVGIVISGLIGSTILVQQSQETRKYASAGWCKVEDNGVTAGFVPCDTPGETLQGTYEQVMNIRDNASAITDVSNIAQLEQVRQQVGNANTTVNDEGKREITGGTHGGQENVNDCSGDRCNTGNEGNGAAVAGGGTPSGGAPSGTITTPPVGTGTTGNGTTADNACTAQDSCGGPNQGYCMCGSDGKPDPKGKPTCQGGYEVLGGDCVPVGTKESVSGKPGDGGTHCQSDGDCASGLICSSSVCSEKPKESTAPTSTERYGITDNICHLPGANCVGDEAWRNGSAAARGDIKALAKLKEMNATVFSTVTVDGGVVKVTTPTALATEQPKSQSLTPEVAKKLEPFQSQCSERLGLCPMIDPRDGTTVVGWVPSKVPLFGSYEDAKLARLNISIGDLSGANTPEYGSTAIRSATKEDFEKALAGQLTEENIKKWKALAEKDQLKVGADGQAIKDKDGNILTVSGSLNKAENDRREALFLQQETAKAIAQDNIVDAFLKTNKDEIQNAIIECIQINGKEKCTAEYIKNVYKDALKNISTDRLSLVLAGIKGQVDDIGKKHDTALTLFSGSSQTLLDACKKENNNVPCGDEKLDAFRSSNMKFLSDGDQKKIVDENLSFYNTLLDPENFETKICADQEKNCQENRAALFDLLTTNQKRSVEQKWLAYETSKRDAEARNKEIDQALVDLDKLIQDNIDTFTRMSVPNTTKNQVLGNLIYGTFDTSKYPHLSDAEKKNFEDAYTRKMLASVRANTKPEDLAFAAPKIVELENALPQAPKGSGRQSLVAAETTPSTENTQQTVQNLTWQQQLLLGGEKNMEWFNNLSYNQAIRNKAADFGYGSDNALIGTGRLLNTVTNGGFGQYAATYADVNAQNPNATYLNRAFNSKGMDATSTLIAKTVTQFAADGGVVSEPLLNGMLNAPLFGPARYASALGLNAQAIENVAATGDLSQIPNSYAVNFMNVTGLEDLVNTSNRLFYQIGMTPEEADDYRQAAQCGDLFGLKGLNPFDCSFDFSNPTTALNRLSDAFEVGSTAVSFGDVAASTALYTKQALITSAKAGVKVTPEVIMKSTFSGAKQTFVESTLADKGFKQGTELFVQAYTKTNGNLGQKIFKGLQNVVDEGMPNTQKATNAFLTIIGKTDGKGGGGFIETALSETKRIGVMPDSHSMGLDDYKRELFERGIIDAEGNPIGGVILGDWFSKADTDLLTPSNLHPGNDLFDYSVDLAKKSNGKIELIMGNHEPRVSVAIAAALRGDTGQLGALLSDSLPKSEVDHILSSPENIRKFVSNLGELKTVVKIGDTVFSHTDTAQELLYSLNPEDLKRLKAIDPNLSEELRYLIYQQKYSGINNVNSFGFDNGRDLLKKSDPKTSAKFEAILLKYESDLDLIMTESDAAILNDGYEKIIKIANKKFRVLTADEIGMFGDAYKKLGFTSTDITDRVNANASAILTNGITLQQNPTLGINNPGNLSNYPRFNFVQADADINAQKAYVELQIFHNNISIGEAYWKDGGASAQAYAGAFDAKQLAFGHSPLGEPVFQKPIPGFTTVSPGVFTTGDITLYNFDTNLSFGMRRKFYPTTNNPNGFLPRKDGVLQLPDDRSLLQPLNILDGPKSVDVTIQNLLPIDLLGAMGGGGLIDTQYPPQPLPSLKDLEGLPPKGTSGYGLPPKGTSGDGLPPRGSGVYLP